VRHSAAADCIFSQEVDPGVIQLCVSWRLMSCDITIYHKLLQVIQSP